jgi:hypothetical protein
MCRLKASKLTLRNVGLFFFDTFCRPQTAQVSMPFPSPYSPYRTLLMYSICMVLCQE